MLLVRMVHVLSSMWFICGLVGRWLAYAQARRTADIHSVGALLRLSDRFERLMVMPGSQAVLVFGLLTAWLQGQPLLGGLRGARPTWLVVSLVLFVSMVPVVIVVLIPRRRRRLQALDDALAHEALTPALAAALGDRVVLACRMVELLVVALILMLMLTKPF